MKNYTTLIREASPTLKTLLLPIDDRNNTRAELVLRKCSMEVISSITIIMVIGRDALEYPADYPCKAPAKEFMEWAKSLWSDDPITKEEDIEYLCSKRDLREYLLSGKQALRIK